VCAFAGGWVLVGLHVLGVPEGAAVLAGAATASGLRVLALLLDWQLPRWSPGPD
jgi:uncharacterized membrane protein YeiH